MRAPKLMAAVLLVAAACDDASVEVRFAIPDQYRDLVSTVSLKLLVPSPLAPFGCDDIAFQVVDEQTIDPVTIQEVNLQRKGSTIPLSGIPRTGDKLFLAQGLDAGLSPVVAGCAALGDVDGSVTVTITGEPVPTLQLPPQKLGDPLPANVRIQASDARGDALGVEARWVVTGPAGETHAGTVTTDGIGQAMIAAPQPVLPGPSALDIALRWGAAPDTVLGFREPAAIKTVTFALPGNGMVRVPNSDGLYQVGRIGPNGEPGVAALGPADDLTQERQVEIVWYGPSGFEEFQSAPVGGVVTLGLIREPARDRVITIARVPMQPGQWIEFGPDASVSAMPVAVASPARRIVSIGSCDGGPDAILAWFADVTGYVAYAADGTTISSPFTGQPSITRLLNSGCAETSDGSATVRAVVYGEGLLLTVIADMPGGIAQGTLVATPRVAFAPRVDADGPRLLATTLAIDGTSLGRYTLAPGGPGEVLLQEETRDDLLTTGSLPAAGDFDNDHKLDVATVLSLGESDVGTQVRTFVALGTTHLGDHRLAGISPESIANSPTLFATDFDNNLYTDLVLATPTQFTIALLGP